MSLLMEQRLLVSTVDYRHFAPNGARLWYALSGVQHAGGMRIGILTR